MITDDLEGISSVRDVARMGKVLLLSRDPQRRASAARVLGESGYRSAYAYLRRAFWDPSEEVRLSAVHAVERLAVLQSAGELADLYAEATPRVRRAVLRVAGSAAAEGFDRFRGVLRLGVDDPDRRARSLAERAVAKSALSAPCASGLVAGERRK
jgi:hypothetical protein